MEDSGPRIHHLGETVPWPSPPAAEATEPDVMEQEPTSRRTLATAAALLVAGVVLGTLGVAAVQSARHGSATTPTAAVGAPQGTDSQSGQGGFDGEQRLQGTVTAIGAGSITVQTSGGTATYVVNAETDIRRDGVPAQLSELRAGDAVLVHVYPSGGASVAERVLVTTTGTGTARAT